MRVLVVDDDPQILRILARLVPSEHLVVRARSKAEALRALAENPDFGLGLVDVELDDRYGGVAISSKVRLARTRVSSAQRSRFFLTLS